MEKLLLEKVREKVPTNRNFHEVKRAFNKISAPLKIKVVQGKEKKRKAENNEAAAEATASLSMTEVTGGVSEANGGRQKKEKKKFDLEDQYKNIELPTFKGALVDTINTED